MTNYICMNDGSGQTNISMLSTANGTRRGKADFCEAFHGNFIYPQNFRQVYEMFTIGLELAL